jgi:hypothetical protein
MRIAVMLALLAACDHGLDQRLAIVDEPRVLAVISEPAEAKPRTLVTAHALIAGPDGPIATPPSWAWCAAPKPPTEDNAVSDGCLGEGQLLPLGTGPTSSGTLPADGCLRFGPDIPPGTDFRSRDADASGGYYQPLRLDVDGLLAFGMVRITCSLARAPLDVAFEYDQRYVANRNPTLLPFTLDRAPGGSDVTLRAAWPDDAAESYLYFDPAHQALVDRRESMRVSWFATGGTIDVDASAVGEDDGATEVSTTWHTPGPGTAWVWIVLRDARGGIATQAHIVTLE